MASRYAKFAGRPPVWMKITKSLLVSSPDSIAWIRPAMAFPEYRENRVTLVLDQVIFD